MAFSKSKTCSLPLQKGHPSSLQDWGGVVWSAFDKALGEAVAAPTEVALTALRDSALMQLGDLAISANYVGA
jgi:hypothetical protein